MKNKLKYLIMLVMLIALTVSTAVSASAQEATLPDEEVEEGFFGSVYSEISEYTGEILSAMTFIGSIALAIAYKKGLLPLMQGSILSLSNAVSKIRDNAKESAERGEALGEKITEGLGTASDTLSTLAERIGALEISLAESLNTEKAAKKNANATRLVMDAQIDMLYSIFMSSALPQYQKDAVGERVAKMKEAIAKDVTEE